MRMLDWPLATVPQVRVAGRFVLGDHDFATTHLGRAHALHLHDYAGRMRLAGEEVTLEPGDVTISPAGRPSGYDLSAPGRHWCVHFDGGTRETGIGIPLPLHVRLDAAAAASVRERMAHVARLHAHGGDSPIAAASAGLALQELLLWLAERNGPQAPASAGDAAVERAAAIIDARFHERLAAPMIAREVGRSQSALGRNFRARFGVTIPHRLLQRRVEHARFLLESTDLPIWRVAERVGIPDPHHFNKTVRRLLGASPSAIRAAAGGAPVDPDR